jgi:hypothetical protein
MRPVKLLDLQIFPRIFFEKIRNEPNVIFRGLGEDEKEAKNFVTPSL